MPKTISASVGIHGSNLTNDTETVQTLLNGTPEDRGGANPKLEVDGKCGPKTCHAISMFQLTHFGWAGADGRVDPDGPTLFMLNLCNPDPVVTPAQPPPPKQEPLSNQFLFWLPHPSEFFTQPYDPNEFVFSVVDMTNHRAVSYGLKFHNQVGMPPPGSGSGGYMAHVELNQPTMMSGLGGRALYQTQINHGSGPESKRLQSRLWVAMEQGSGYVADFDCHILRPGPDGQGVVAASDPAVRADVFDGQIRFNLEGELIRLS